MLRYLLVLVVFFNTFAHAQGTSSSACIWSGTVANCLPAAGIYLPDQRGVRYGEAAAQGVNYVNVAGPNTLAGNVTLLLPVDDGDANEFLQTDGSGNMSWEPVESGDISGVILPVNGGTGVANNNTSTLTMSGNFATTFTRTNTTNVTFPTTGTLATLDGTETFTNKTLTSPKINENVALTTTATKLNYLTSATGTAGTASTNVVFSTAPTFENSTIVSKSLANGEFVYHQAKNSGSPNRTAEVGVTKNASITNSAGYVFMNQEDGSNSWVWVATTGNLMIGSTAANVGSATGTIVGTQSSDSRLKKDISEVPYGLAEIEQLSPKKFTFIGQQNQELGFLAQDVRKILPEVVYDTGDTRKGNEHLLAMKYYAIVPVLVNALKELNAKFDAYVATHP